MQNKIHTVQVSEVGFWEVGVWAEFQLLVVVVEAEEEHSLEAPSSRKRNMQDFIFIPGFIL